MAYGYYASITIDHTKVSGDGDLTNFPILVSGTYDGTGSEPDIRTVANGGKVQNTASGGATGSVTVPADLVFSPNTDGSSPYDFEIESYDAATGAIVAWVEIPTLDGDADTVLYMVYGDSGVTTSQEDVAGTWNANYLGVWHMSADGTDSTSSGYDFTGVNTPTHGTSYGKIGSGVKFTKADADYYKVTDANSPNIESTGDYTIQTWVNPLDLTHKHVLWAKDGLGTTSSIRGNYIEINEGQDKGIHGITYNTSSFIYNILGTTVTAGNWYFYVARKDEGTKIDLSRNLTTTDSDNYSGTTNTSDCDITIGVFDNFSAGAYGDTQQDEIRFSNVYLTDDWIATDYATQSDPSTFYTMGTETASGGGTVTPQPRGCLTCFTKLWGI